MAQLAWEQLSILLNKLEEVARERGRSQFSRLGSCYCNSTLDKKVKKDVLMDGSWFPKFWALAIAIILTTAVSLLKHEGFQANLNTYTYLPP